MKEFYRNLFEFVSFLKVACICLASLYLIFWFYRFFNLPLTGFMRPFFDFFVIPIKSMFSTEQTFNNAVIEMAYFIMGIILACLSFILGRIEDLVVELDRRYDIKELVKKQMLEKQVNKELERAHIENLLKYRFFSIYLAYKINFANEVVAASNGVPLSALIEKSYNNTISLIKQRVPDLNVEKYGASIFIRGNWVKNFDEIIEYILDAIKVVKVQNYQVAANTTFLLAMDAQTDKISSDKSFETLVKIAGMEYYGKAVVTLPFKIRFDLIQKDSIFMTDAIGYAVMDENKNEEEDSELYLLKSKPRQI